LPGRPRRPAHRPRHPPLILCQEGRLLDAWCPARRPSRHAGVGGRPCCALGVNMDALLTRQLGDCAMIFPVTAVAIPGPEGLAIPVDDLYAFTDAWLGNRRLSEHTRDAYRRDVRSWLRWCEQRDLDPLRATFIHVNTYARALESTVDPRTNQPFTPATVARKMSGLSSWYAFLQKIGAVTANPVGGADRPRVDRDHSATVGLSPDEVDR